MTLTLYPMLVKDGAKTTDELWVEALTTVSHLRMTAPRLYPPSVFVPFAIITAVDKDLEAHELSITNEMIVGERHPDHEERVRALCNALDLIRSQPHGQAH